MLTRVELKNAIRDFETLSRSEGAGRKPLNIDIAAGHLYEAYAQMVLDERHLNVDVTSICGFMRYAKGSALNRVPSQRILAIARHTHRAA